MSPFWSKARAGRRLNTQRWYVSGIVWNHHCALPEVRWKAVWPGVCPGTLTK